ncbi:MAG: hypothetical protein ABIJ09_20560 [Pseudomonadota bacterium]
MNTQRNPLLFDAGDLRMLEMVGRASKRGKGPALIRRLFDPYLHPRGIKELAAPKSLRLAAAMVDLLETLHEGTAQERIAALREVRAEVMHDSSQKLRLNVARVLLQIMKELVRARGDEDRQLALAHDFREASSGNPRRIRNQLRRYHLLEMPEAWNQLAFDHHVHDANTKGRKSPTHLIMDAWIKGLRFLGVIYYNHVRPEVAAELLEAAEIMGVDVRIGVEVSARLRDRYAHLVWAPRGFLNRRDFVSFLQEPEVERFMAQGREVAAYERRAILELLRSFNARHLPALNQEFGIELPPLDEEAFSLFVGPAQASLVHLAEFVHAALLPLLRARVQELCAQHDEATGGEKNHLAALIRSLDELVPEVLVERYLRPEINPTASNPSRPSESDDVPDLLRLGPAAMIARLGALPCRSRITLNPTNLEPAHVLQVLHEGGGHVSHLEIFNLKDWAQGRTEHRTRINDLRLVLNSGNVVEAKRLVRTLLHELEQDPRAGSAEQCENLRGILRDLPGLLECYRTNRLHSRLGSDSIGRSRHSRGMGLVVVSTLPPRARRQLRRDGFSLVPVTTTVQRQISETVKSRGAHGDPRQPRGPRSSAVWFVDNGRQVTWSVGHNATTLSAQGNIASLGGLAEETGNGLASCLAGARENNASGPGLAQLNSALLNIGKITLGFIPAFLTFFLTKDWWLLSWFGAVIWFAITGGRNIVQSIVGGGGLRPRSLLHWNDFVSWNRVADSLLFTGFSVPLLDFLVKDLLLSRSLGVTTTTGPLLLYSVMALANGIYISSHNTYRGLPLAAIVGNFFRTVISIPVAVGLNALLFTLARRAGLSELDIQAGLQLWAAVISKAASDLVAAIIEGSADRQHNLSHRTMDYREKLEQLFDAHGRMEMAFPEAEVLHLIDAPKELVHRLKDRAEDVLHLLVVNALDLLYFWMYQPRAQTALRQFTQHMSDEEKQVLWLSQQVLTRKRLVSEMLLKGLVGKRFERALAFYLSSGDRYLAAMRHLLTRH